MSSSGESAGGEPARTESASPAALITCARCGKEATPLPAPPLTGTRGQTIQQHVCPECWQAWIDQSTLLINHYGIQVADPAQRQQLYAVMAEFLNLRAL
jgi:Fe-S cluster biosynthesis and repair protein YggX